MPEFGPYAPPNGRELLGEKVDESIVIPVRVGRFAPGGGYYDDGK